MRGNGGVWKHGEKRKDREAVAPETVRAGLDDAREET